MLMMDKLLQEISARLDEFESGGLPPQADLEKMQNELAALLRAPVYREAEREYVHSDALAVYYTADGRPVTWQADVLSTTPVFVVYVRLSWMAAFAMLDWKRTENGREWRSLREDQLASEFTRISDEIRRFLENQHYKVLSGPILDQTLPGRISELDDAALTVREALFSALD